jgi:hypothetical protein
MALKAAIEAFPKYLRVAIVDYAGTNHDDHLCADLDVQCETFDALIKAIQQYDRGEIAREEFCAFRSDGKRCERIAGHNGAHRNQGVDL